MGEYGVSILVGQSEDLAGGVEFDDLEAKSRKVDIELSTQFEGVHLIGNGELPRETEERLKQHPLSRSSKTEASETTTVMVR